MVELERSEYATYDEFARQWDAPETETRMLWQLLGQLDPDEVVIEIPEWLAEENTGYVDGSVPTTFIGRIAEETEKAIRFRDSASVRPLMNLAHRIHQLEESEADPEGSDWLDKQLEKHQNEFEKREDATVLSEEWLPKSQVLHVVKRRDACLSG